MIELMIQFDLDNIKDTDRCKATTNKQTENRPHSVQNVERIVTVACITSYLSII
jgi:hypothetical protein